MTESHQHIAHCADVGGHLPDINAVDGDPQLAIRPRDECRLNLVDD
ncbi:hypothetical protein [Amycolatopsis sp. FDAARGOS 1241]|nr:hypothetical protein [Amycolatopsis sp. FDAARGOS 1241]QRP43065.1 hypothetical protein I6J71_26945 [Amycolatopsis sp. FDAARGOS 1241]